MSTKGQALSYDFFISCIIFVLIITIIFSLFRYSNTQISDNQEINQITRTSQQLSELWMREGSPRDWDSSNIIDLGLMSNSRFNQTKLNQLEDIGYSEVKNIAGVGFYEFYLKIYNSDNNTIFDFGLYPLDSEFISKSQRFGILNSTIVFVDTVVWK
ncbi:MAG: hypothetical protein GF368_01245 [Candidatus Aenigmarchaeota archaeon]|nr:hypothetical protein [Candidatus Aenigmarchaeota archaeon]